MRCHVLPLLLALVGCDQVFGVDGDRDGDLDGVIDELDRCAGFDDRLDEDDDGVPDDCDNCPNVSNEAQDNVDAATGDSVGDACDPDRRLGTSCPHRLGLFDDFARNALEPWVPAEGAWTSADGAVAQTALPGGRLHLPGRRFENVTVIVTAHLTSPPSTTTTVSRVGIAVSNAELNASYNGYLCALGTDDTGTYATLIGHFSNNFENPIAENPATGPVVEGGSLVLIQDDHPAEGRRGCELRQIAPTTVVGQASNNDATWTGGTLVLETAGATATFESVVVIERVGPCP